MEFRAVPSRENQPPLQKKFGENKIALGKTIVALGSAEPLCYYAQSFFEDNDIGSKSP